MVREGFNSVVGVEGVMEGFFGVGRRLGGFERPGSLRAGDQVFALELVLGLALGSRSLAKIGLIRIELNRFLP